jgi:FAD binding domain
VAAKPQITLELSNSREITLMLRQISKLFFGIQNKRADGAESNRSQVRLNQKAPESRAGQPGRVVIVGAGPAGMALAYLLARRGVAVTVLESHLDFARVFRGEGLQQSGIDTFRQMGLGSPKDTLFLRLEGKKLRAHALPDVLRQAAAQLRDLAACIFWDVPTIGGGAASTIVVVGYHAGELPRQGEDFIVSRAPLGEAPQKLLGPGQPSLQCGLILIGLPELGHLSRQCWHIRLVQASTGAGNGAAKKPGRRQPT